VHSHLLIKKTSHWSLHFCPKQDLSYFISFFTFLFNFIK
jgi:hypothetical protein